MLLELVPAIIDKYGSISSTAAADWYKQMRSKWFDDKYEPILADPIHDDLTDMIRAKASMLFKGNERYDPNAYLSYLNRLIAVGVRNGGRSTVRSAAKLDKYGPRFARVPSGLHTCAFCAMLAGRGFVYASAEKAGGLFNKYHAACDCEIVPSWDEKPRVEGYRPDELYDDYLKARMRPEAIRWTISFARCDSIRVNTRMESVREPPSLMVGSSLMRRTRNDCFQCEDSLASPIANGTCVRKRLEFRTPPIRCIRRKSCSLNDSRILGTMSNGYQET